MGNVLDLVGQKYGRLTVLSFSRKNKHNQAVWLCRCECGTEKEIPGAALRSGKSTSCGCYKREYQSLRSMNNLLEMKGKVFGKLKVAEIINEGYQSQMCLCECSCGSTVVVFPGNLTRGHTKSCGCLRSDFNVERNFKHGKCTTPEYRAWSKMKRRCYNPDDNRFYRYGARGIKVCQRWMNSFESFFEDMGPRPSPKHSLDRINVNGDYEPSNCKWSTITEQARNKDLFSKNKSGKSGVSWSKINSKWRSVIMYNGKSIHLGCFENVEDAIRAREEAELKYWGKSS